MHDQAEKVLSYFHFLDLESQPFNTGSYLPYARIQATLCTNSIGNEPIERKFDEGIITPPQKPRGKVNFTMMGKGMYLINTISFLEIAIQVFT